ANQTRPRHCLPSRVGERSFGGLAGCPNAAQPELQIVSTPLLGLAVGDGKGAVAGARGPHRTKEVLVNRTPVNCGIQARKGPPAQSARPASSLSSAPSAVPDSPRAQ